ncbi:hypothetical protein JCM3766R1_000198 [Sporobolomyces carnicolor]
MSSPPRLPTSSSGDSTTKAANASDKGFWSSLSPEDQKKYTLVFLVSLGTTLLVTGRSGGSLLKRAKKSEATARPRPPPPPPPPTPIPNPVQPLAQQRRRVEVPDNSDVKPPPTSFLHPNELSPFRSERRRGRRRLLPSFVATTTTTTTTPTSAYFLPNPFLTSESTRYAKELDRQDKLHEDGREPEEPEGPVVDDGFNPAVYAAKALGIATVITFTSFGVGIFGLMKWLGVSDMDGLSLALTHRLGGTLKEHRPSLPAWALPSSSPSSSPSPSETSSSKRDKEVDDEATSYWSQVKETLDREAEERKLERSEQWTRFLQEQERQRKSSSSST